jgi:enterochelin esterase-like enzyme
MDNSLSQSGFADALLAGKVADFLSKYDSPICEVSGCLLVTSAPNATEVSVHGSFNSWADTNAIVLTEVEDEPGIFYGLLPVPGVDDVLEYKLKRDGEWALDASNAYIAFGGYGPNSAVYGASRGRITLIEDVHSPELDNSRSLYVYLPVAYFDSQTETYPVLYMQDGFNVFQNPQAPFGSWDVDVALDTEIAKGTVQSCIVVGIDTGDRLAEYTHGKFNSDAPEPKLPAYAQFLSETVVPVVDDTFRTKKAPQYRAISGASLGGSSALWIALTKPNVFGAAGSLSGSFWIGEDNDTVPMRELILGGAFIGTPDTVRIYLDTGSISSTGTENYAGDSWVYNDWTRNALITVGWANRLVWDTDGDLDTPPADLPLNTPMADVPRMNWSSDMTAAELLPDTNLISLVAVGQSHNEAAWKQRFKTLVRFLFAP